MTITDRLADLTILRDLALARLAAVAPTVGTVNVAEGGGGETVVITPFFGTFE